MLKSTSANFPANLTCEFCGMRRGLNYLYDKNCFKSMFTSELVYPIRGQVIFKYVGQLTQVLAFFVAVPAVVSAMIGSLAFTLTSGIVAAVLGLVGWYLGRIHISSKIQQNEALVIVSLTFLIAALAMTFPMIASGLAPVDAFFESVSGVTTTGLSVGSPVVKQSVMFHFTRAWMQWFGGLGIVIFSVALVNFPGVDARRMSTASSGDKRFDMVGGTKMHANRVLVVYFSLSALGLFALLLTGTSFFDSMIHMLSSVSTGGFSTTNQSIGGLPSVAGQVIALALGVLGAIPFALYYLSGRRKSLKRLAQDPEIKTFIAVLGGSSLLLIFILYMNGGLSWSQSLSHGAALAVSAQTTTGYSTLEVSSIPASAKLLLIISMFIGANSGSTAGGVKLLRIVLLWKMFQSLIRRKSMPSHAVAEPRLQNRRIPTDEIIDAGIIFALFLLINTASWLIFLIFGYQPLDSLFDVVSATGTVGLSSGVTGSQLPAGLKLLLCANMLLGRLEMIALLILFYPNTWIGKRRSSS